MYARRGGPLRLVRSLRGDGTLMWGRRAARPVSYSIDLYAQGELMSGDGDICGEFTDLVGRMPSDARLKLASGETVQLKLGDIAADTASIELLRPALSPAAA
jgi:hypothetical protein